MIIGGVVVIFLSLAPFAFLSLLLVKFKTLCRPSSRASIGSLYLGIKDDSKSAAAAYTPLFLLRRSFFVMLTFASAQQPNLQVHFFIYLSLWYVIYLGHALPHETMLLTNVELTNECIFLVICYNFVLFTDLIDDFNTSWNLGWSCISLILMLVAFNSFIVGLVLLKALFRKLKLMKLKEDAVKMRGKLREAKEKLK